jgi:hypothetical protein
MPVILGQLVTRQALVNVIVGPTAARAAALKASGVPVAPVLPLDAILGNGAGITCIDPSVRQALNLTPFALRAVSLPGNPNPVHAYYFKISLTIVHPTNNPQWDLSLPALDVAETQLAQTGQNLLVGCDVLSLCDVYYSGRTSSFALAYGF